MNSSAEILVVILSIFLAFFLILGIILMIYLIVLTHQIRKVTKSAEQTVGDVGVFISNVSKIVSPVFVAEMFTRFIKKVKTTKKNKSNKEEE